MLRREWRTGGTLHQRERVVELFEELCGARLTYNYVRPGGVSFDAPEGWTDRVVRPGAPRDGRPADPG